MINPKVLERKPQTTENRNVLMSFLALWKRQFNEMFSKVLRSETLSVKVTNNAESIFLLKQLLREMESVVINLRKASKSNPKGQEISLKTTDLVTLNKTIEDILRRIEKKDLVLNLPKMQKIFGSVRVENLPQQYDFNKLTTELIKIQTSIANLRLEVPPFPKIEQPNITIPKFPDKIEVPEIKTLIKEMQEVKNVLKDLPAQIPEMEFPNSISIDNFPPQKIPQPVTNININPLRGEVMTRTVTVGTTRKPLPGEVLTYRRGVIIFNNDATDTVYIGGANVTTTDGLPILPQTYSPAIDAGPRMILYGISAGSADVRVMEISNENVGT